jgi:hypothetical protein
MLHELPHNIGPVPHIDGLFLHPVDLFYVLVGRQDFSQLLFGKRIELLYSDNGGIVLFVLSAGSDQLVEDFPGAEDEAAGFGRENFGVGEDFLEGALGQIIQAAHGLRMPQKALWRENNERPTGATAHLPTQRVKEVCWTGEVADVQVVLGGQDEKPFWSGTGMFRPLPLVAMWQIHD